MLLEVKDLAISFSTPRGTVHAVKGVSFNIDVKQGLALVGESGSGKSATALALTRLLAPNGNIVGGSVMFCGRDLLQCKERALRDIRGGGIAYIFQEPASALNPLLTIGKQITEAIQLHDHDCQDRRKKAITLLERVGIRQPEARMRSYPHQLSGGMLQRAMIAMALACGPKLLVADEPTTALDVTIQEQILRLLEELEQELGLATLLITHDLRILKGIVQWVAVMYAGFIVEYGLLNEILFAAKHPYTQCLLAALPDTSKTGGDLYSIPGTLPTPFELRKGCYFAPRCPKVKQECWDNDPPKVEFEKDHWALCWLYK